MLTYVFISVGYIPRSGMAGSYGTCMFNFSKKLPNCLLKWRHHFFFYQLPTPSSLKWKLQAKYSRNWKYFLTLPLMYQWMCVCQTDFGSLTPGWKIKSNAVDSLPWISHPSMVDLVGTSEQPSPGQTVIPRIPPREIVLIFWNKTSQKDHHFSSPFHTLPFWHINSHFSQLTSGRSLGIYALRPHYIPLSFLAPVTLTDR